METIVFIATYKAGTTREAIKTARHLGYSTVLFTDRSRYLKQKDDFPEVDRMILTSLKNIENLRKQIEEMIQEGTEIQAIISLIDPYVSTAAQLSRELCGRNISVSAFRIMENKIETRKALEDTPFNINYLTYSTSDSCDDCLKLDSLHFPLVIKSPISSGSRDVFFAETPEMFIDIMTNAKREYPNNTLLIEEYVQGDQYLVEIVAINGEIHPVAIIKQDINFNQRFIVTGYSINQNLSNAFYDNLIESIEKILNIIGLKDGTCHLELRLKDNQWKLIEMNPRMSGGSMNHIIKEAFGIDLLEQTIEFYLGHAPFLDRKKEENVYTYYVTSKCKGVVKKITGVYKARQISGVKEVKINVRKGNTVYSPLSMGHRIAYIISTGKTIEKAEKSAKKAASLIKIHLESSKDSKEDIQLDKKDIKSNKEITLKKEDIILSKEDIKLNKEDIILNKEDIILNEEDIKLDKE